MNAWQKLKHRTIWWHRWYFILELYLFLYFSSSCIYVFLSLVLSALPHRLRRGLRCIKQIMVDRNFPVKLQLQASTYSDYCSDLFFITSCRFLSNEGFYVFGALHGSPSKTLSGRSVCFSDLGAEQSSKYARFHLCFSSFQWAETSSWHFPQWEWLFNIRTSVLNTWLCLFLFITETNEWSHDTSKTARFKCFRYCRQKTNRPLHLPAKLTFNLILQQINE